MTVKWTLDKIEFNKKLKISSQFTNQRLLITTQKFIFDVIDLMFWKHFQQHWLTVFFGDKNWKYFFQCFQIFFISCSYFFDCQFFISFISEKTKYRFFFHLSYKWLILNEEHALNIYCLFLFLIIDNRFLINI